MLRINSHNKLPFTHKRIASYFLIYYLFQYYKIIGFKFTQLDGPCQFVSFCFYFSFETKIINNSSDFSANIFFNVYRVCKQFCLFKPCFFFSPYFSSPTSGKIMVLPLSYWKQTRVNSFNERPSFFNLVLLPKCSDFEFFWYYSLFFTTLISFLSFRWRICRHINDSLQNRNQGTFRAVVVFTEWGVIIAVTSLLYYKTVRIFAYSSTREQSNKRSGTGWKQRARRRCEARALRTRKTLSPRFTDFFTDFEEKNRLFCSLLACQQVLHLWAKQFARELASEWQSREGPFFPRPSHSRLLSRAALPWLLATPQMESFLAGCQSQAGCQRPAVKMATFFVALVDSTTLRRF